MDWVDCVISDEIWWGLTDLHYEKGLLCHIWLKSERPKWTGSIASSLMKSGRHFQIYN